MALKKHPHFQGQIIVDSTNNKVVWEEQTSGSYSETITSGTYTIAALITEIATKMNTATLSGNVYGVGISKDTGLVTVSRVSGTETFMLGISTSDTGSIFCGGIVDSNAAALSVGQRGMYNMGWSISNSLTLGTSFVSDKQPTGVWSPSWPPSKNSQPYYDNTVVESYSLSGAGVPYVFNSWSLTTGNFPYFSGREQIDLQFELIDEDEMEQYLAWFWGPCASLGLSFRYYDEWDDTNYRTCVLSGESLEKGKIGERPYGVLLHSFNVMMRGVS